MGYHPLSRADLQPRVSPRWGSSSETKRGSAEPATVLKNLQRSSRLGERLLRRGYPSAERPAAIATAVRPANKVRQQLGAREPREQRCKGTVEAPTARVRRPGVPEENLGWGVGQRVPSPSLSPAGPG